MFSIIKGILGHSDKKSQSHESVHLPAGRLNLIRPSYNTKLSKECIYLEASLSIQRTSIPFHYQLVINRMEEDQSSEDEDFEKVFLLDEKLKFLVYESADDSGDDEDSTTFAFSWIDVSSPEASERFEYVINTHHPDCSDENINQAADIIYQCIWEAMNEQDSSQAPEEELVALRNDATQEIMRLERSFSDGSEVERSFQNSSKALESIDEYGSEEDQSDSSADEIVNQLMGTTLSDKIIPPSLPIACPSQSSHVITRNYVDQSPRSQKPKSTPIKKVQIVSPESPRYPEPQISHSPARKPTTTTTHQSLYQAENTPEQSNVENSVASDVVGSPSASSPTANLIEQGHEEESIEFKIPLTDAANEPSADQSRLAWKARCNLYIFDSDEVGFKLFRSEVIVELLVSKPNNPNHRICWLRIIDPSLNHVRLVSTSIQEENNLVHSNGVIFFNETNSAQSCTWVLKFPENDDRQDQLAIAREAFAKALYERDNGIGTYEHQDNASKGWDRLRYGMLDEAARAEEDDKEFNEQEEDEESDQGDLSSDEEDDAQLRKFRSKSTGPKNSQLAVGFHEDISFVVRSNMLGLFKNEATNGQKLKFMTTIPDICTPDGKRDLVPSKIMLHQQDSTMVLQDPSNPNSLFNLDLGTGKVVEEWKISEQGSIRDFFPRTKFSQMNPEATFLGTSADSFYTIDPRLNGYKAVSEESKSYKTKPDFSCATTTESGQIALGSNKGEIRLYDSHIGKNAKTLLPALKDPILAIDVCKDGAYLIATCEKYLILVDCTLPGSNILGFQKSFPKAQKPTGQRIELTPEHRAQMHAEKIPIRFKPAKFNQGQDAVEKTIVTSIGPYIIAYDFRKLKMGQTDYTLKRYEENVVADSFRWGNDKDIVVTMPSSVFLEKRKKLSKPIRESLVFVNQPSRSRPSTSRIRTGNSSLGVVQEWES